ncbi:AMP-dependent synthetase/ligase, AMP-binding enzyme C-terminal domain protein [Artemisia annua]|uniref:AMP-dependent synthetase/ligase, AMP-binding enzyme C-terminal domain protein n=1 Tax=Artemisia annua TaxID=35608 RepID=A0A2U1PJ09_ARTAN|nr:AMP-dependent synthetase/ligase, AMP-binding enzyme C-terminal domain protein [Artemisia annua]
MTKTGGIISIEGPRVGSRHSGSSGTLCAGMESQVIHTDTLKPLPLNHLGEIWVRGPNLMKEYFHNKETTEEIMDAAVIPYPDEEVGEIPMAYT